ncbi:CUE domain-containing protein 2 [Ascaphus truei]|uniref:CUE domain-containing protein 2 n=1 Tax=Ascaphus truei TaxID=8439 RepID=UPI003F595B47
MSLERIIRDSLTSFIQSHIPDAGLGAMDEVVFSYITGVLEELGSQDSSEEDFEIESLVEMMEGYIPGFAEIGSVNICEMMFQLSGRLSEARSKGNLSSKSAEEASFVAPENRSKEPTVNGDTKLATSTEGATAQKDDLKNSLDLLLEMFPSCTVSQAQGVMSMAKGDLAEAVQMIVEREVKLDSGSKESQRAPKKKDLKDFILQKYMMVDNEEDKKMHKPLAPKEAPKKLVRYIDNQVVSTKGERYKDMKKPESEEMKKTYINLKPARKYKFH